jgi:sarcosine oxidase delta subunit
MKRHRNGRIKSKRDYEIECKTRNYTLMITFLIVAFFSITFTPWTGTYHNIDIDTKTANAQEIVQEEEPASTEPVYTDKVQQAINEIPHTSSTTEKWISYIYEQSEKEGVDGDTMLHIAWCESQFRNIQSNCIYDFTDAKIGIYAGEQEKSYGIFMFSTPHHPMTVQQALDPYYSTDRAISFVKNGDFIWWGYSPKNDNCLSGVKPYWK